MIRKGYVSSSSLTSLILLAIPQAYKKGQTFRLLIPSAPLKRVHLKNAMRAKPIRKT
jgi:hypothetical protein